MSLNSRWIDDFDGPAGAPPSPRHWSAELGGGGWGDDQLQVYTEANATLDGNGNLAIVARREAPGITSARLITKGRVAARYGRVAGVGKGIGAAFDAGVVLAGDFHTYAVDWTTDRITWSLDGDPYNSIGPPDVPAWVFDHDFYLLINLAIGGNWPGNALDEDSLPATMLVDWVAWTPAWRPATAPARRLIPTC